MRQVLWCGRGGGLAAVPARELLRCAGKVLRPGPALSMPSITTSWVKVSPGSRERREMMATIVVCILKMSPARFCHLLSCVCSDCRCLGLIGSNSVVMRC